MPESEGAEGAPEGTEAPPETTAPSLDFGPIQARMDEMTAQQQQLVEQFGQQFGQVLERLPEPEPEPEYLDDPSWYDDTGNFTQEGLLERARQEGIEAGRAGAEQFWTEQSRESALAERQDKWLEALNQDSGLKDPKYAEAVVNEAAALVGHNDAVIESPGFVEIIKAVHAMRTLAERAAAETPVQPGVVLESAQGAAQPSQGSDEVDWGKRIAAAAEKLRPQI